VQPGQHLHGVKKTGSHLVGRGALGVSAQHRFHALPRDQVHRHERRDVRRLARVGEEHVRRQRTAGPLDRLLQPRLAQHVTVADRGQPGRRDLEHDRGFPGRHPGQLDQEGQAGGAAGQRGQAGHPRAGTPVGDPPRHPVPQLSQQSVVGLAGGHHALSLIRETTIF
jgi:hypothetical protein